MTTTEEAEARVWALKEFDLLAPSVQRHELLTRAAITASATERWGNDDPRLAIAVRTAVTESRFKAAS